MNKNNDKKDKDDKKKTRFEKAWEQALYIWDLISPNKKDAPDPWGSRNKKRWNRNGIWASIYFILIVGIIYFIVRDDEDER